MPAHSPTRVVGVDFSASARDAGAKTWVTHATVGDDRLRVESIRCAADAFDLDTTTRERTLAKLAERIRNSDPDTVFGLDFPFAVPDETSSNWDEFVAAFPTIEGEKIADPEDLYRWGREGENPRLRRATDKDHDAQSPTGWRIKTQTFYGIRDVLGEVAPDESVAVVPMQDPTGEETLVVEIYPAATVRDLTGASGGYKGVREAHWERRAEILAELESGCVSLADDRARPRANDDALDSVVAAFAAFRNTREGPPEVGDDRPTAAGHIFV